MYIVSSCRLGSLLEHLPYYGRWGCLGDALGWPEGRDVEIGRLARRFLVVSLILDLSCLWFERGKIGEHCGS